MFLQLLRGLKNLKIEVMQGCIYCFQFLCYIFVHELQILSSRNEVHTELVQQVLLFMTQNKRLGMVEVCEFLRPFFNFSILQMPFSDSPSSLFVRQLVSSVASLCCSFPSDALPAFKVLRGCLEYFPLKTSKVSLLEGEVPFSLSEVMAIIFQLTGYLKFRLMASLQP